MSLCWFYTISFYACKSNIFFDYKDCLGRKIENFEAKVEHDAANLFLKLWHWLNGPVEVWLGCFWGAFFARLGAVGFVVVLGGSKRSAALQ